jgi:hypothetical protein
LAALVFFVFGMHRGLVLSSDIKSSVWPWAPLFHGRHIQTPALSDPVWQFVPWLRLARRELLAGRLPLWNPHQDAGVPLLANAQSALGSPLIWPVLLLDADPGWNLSLLGRLLLAAGAAFAFLRDLGRTRLASALGAVAFALSGAFVAWLEHPQVLSAAAAPLVFLFARRAAREPGRRATAGLALATYLVVSGGHPETELMVAVLTAGVLLAARRGARRWIRPAAGAALGVGLSAPFLLPFAEYFRISGARLGTGRRPFVLPARDLLRLLLPNLSGSNVIEGAGIVPVVLLLLLPLGLWAGRRDRETRFWALAAASMLFAIYDNPLSRVLALATPVHWTRLLLFLPLALAVVGTAGIDALRGRLAARSSRLALVTAGGAVALGLAEMLWAARGVHGVTPASELAPTSPVLERLAADREIYRVLPLHTFLSPNSATDYGLDDVRGYDALDPAGWSRVRSALGRFTDVPTQRDVIEPWDLAPGGAALDDWNVKYLLLPPQFAFGAEELNAKKGLDLQEVYSGPDGRILLNRRVGPRVRLEAGGEARVLQRVPGRWLIEVRADRPGSVRVADAFFPGWKARVDGALVLLRAHPGEPMTVAFPAGTSRVELYYAPASFRMGVGVAAFSLLALMVLLGSPGSALSAAISRLI